MYTHIHAPSVCALGWVKCREHISLLVILCIIVYVTNKAHLSLILSYLKFANDSEENSVKMLWSALWYQLNSPCLEEEECCLWPQEHLPHRQIWRWKDYALGVFFCEGDRKTAPHQRDNGWGHVPSGHWSQPEHWKWVVDGYSSMTMTQNTWPRQQKSGSRRSTLRSWSGGASLQTLIP